MDKDDQVCHLPTDLISRVGGSLKALVLACLWSSPKISAVGCTQNMVETLVQYTGMDAPDVESKLRELEDIGEACVDWSTNEALVPQWLEFNYLQERSVAERPAAVFKALDEIKSSLLRERLLKEIARLDVHFDAKLSG